MGEKTTYATKLYLDLCQRNGCQPYDLLVEGDIGLGVGGQIRTIASAAYLPSRKHIILSAELVEKLNEQELEGVLAHEHIHGDQVNNGDIALKFLINANFMKHLLLEPLPFFIGLAFTLFALPNAADAAWAFANGTATASDDGSWLIPGMYFGGLAIGSLAQKELEHDADARALRMTGHRGLESALRKFRAEAKNDGFDMFANHPTARSRIKRMQKKSVT